MWVIILGGGTLISKRHVFSTLKAVVVEQSRFEWGVEILEEGIHIVLV